MNTNYSKIELLKNALQATSPTNPVESYATYEIADLLHISHGTALNRLNRGADMPPRVKIGRKWLFPKLEFDQWFKEHSRDSL